MNQLKLKYTGLNFIIEDEDDIKYLKKLNVNLNQLKVINIREYGAFFQNENLFL